MKELRVQVTGRVQGVGFRATTCTTAQQLGISGIVRNKSDGSVEIIAQGEERALKQLTEKLKSIFDADFTSELKEADTVYHDFSIAF